MAERSDVEFKMDDPLNLMRVMPTQGGQPSFSARLIFLTTKDAKVNQNHGLHG